jgi:hypothetical protein
MTCQILKGYSQSCLFQHLLSYFSTLGIEILFHSPTPHPYVYVHWTKSNLSPLCSKWNGNGQATFTEKLWLLCFESTWLCPKKAHLRVRVMKAEEGAGWLIACQWRLKGKRGLSGPSLFLNSLPLPSSLSVGKALAPRSKLRSQMYCMQIRY